MVRAHAYLLWFVLFSVSFGLIHDVPFHRQISRYSCGDASFEMIYHHYREDLDQRAIIDVCRTSFHLGTNTFDLIRAAHFSKLSSAPSNRYYPEQAPNAGWKASLPYGMAAFGYYGDTCWLEELKQLISHNYPIIVLNHFSETSPGGHYRVAVDFDNDSITLLDPWDRHWPRIVRFSNEEFCQEIWNIPESYDNILLPPFWAGFMSPIEVNVSYRATNFSLNEREDDYWNFIELEASIYYPCPAPFCNETLEVLSSHPYVMKETNITLSLPKQMKVIHSGSLVETIGEFRPSETLVKRWIIAIDDSLEVKFGNGTLDDSFITVEVLGKINGHVPEAFCCFDRNGDGGTYYPPYSYTDIIGGYDTVPY